MGIKMAFSEINVFSHNNIMQESSSMHYNFMIVWRLLSCLPPSVQYVRLLESGTLQMSNAHVLHTLRWAPRIGQKVYTNFVKDCLVKQGLTTQQAESSLSTANKTSNNFNYDIRLAMNFIQDQVTMNYDIRLAMNFIQDQVALDEAFSNATGGNVTPTSPKPVAQGLEKVLGPIDSDQFLEKTYHYCISVCQDLVLNFSSKDIGLDEKVLLECLKFIENHLEKVPEKKAFQKFYSEEGGKLKLNPVSEKVSLAILQALIPMGERLLSTHNKDKSGFPELMMVMHTLAGAGQGTGHCIEFQAAIGWLDLCKSYLTEKEVKELITDTNSNKGLLDTLCCLLLFIGEILAALKRSSDRSGVTSPPVENEVPVAQEGDGDDWGEDLAQDDEDSAAEDSDEESLNNKLCTFTMTQKEFMNQHWYHCHTCKMVDGVGVCTVCAKVCHKDHDLTYAKFGSFFCDCGAKDDGSCKALVKRSADSGLDNSDNISGTSPFSMESMLPSSLRRRMSSPGPAEKSCDANKILEQVNKARESLSKQLEGSKEVLIMYLTVTLGSQEGAFENVRMNYSGDQGQQIRQLITAHMLRRVAMCVLASPHGKRQHLAVSHEKGKITILQLSALLKQADSSKRKLTLTRLASAPIPFTVMSITGNPCNEDYLAVCGLKDCHILTFTSSGSVADHLVLHPTLPTGNFIIKAVWLPEKYLIGKMFFLQIYDLGTDALSPQFFFLLPSGKIRDATFICTEEGRYMVLMASSGYIYTQLMDEGSSAKHGPFYITNVLEVKHPELKVMEIYDNMFHVRDNDCIINIYNNSCLLFCCLLQDVNGQVSGGGVSVYYSHALQLLFFSYTQGETVQICENRKVMN
ncbi:hypothetical protein KUTeg_021692 [Tegillarca granosa]|uniref:UBR-type domain-containing protein n=1 Tax=Tegillarca granosa TaxID=220873 RepID=A0ABQ9E428_TEGGR|nr:hypothetical protein KUTeg_021692 [Tegillarca granosa]